MKDHKAKDGTEKPCLSPQNQKAQKRMKPPDTAGAEIHMQLYICTFIHFYNRNDVF